MGCNCEKRSRTGLDPKSGEQEDQTAPRPLTAKISSPKRKQNVYQIYRQIDKYGQNTLFKQYRKYFLVHDREDWA